MVEKRKLFFKRKNNKLKNELSETKKYLEEILIKFKEINERN